MISARLEFATASSLPSWNIACTVSPVINISTRRNWGFWVNCNILHMQHQRLREDVSAAQSYRLMLQTLQSNMRLYFIWKQLYQVASQNGRFSATKKFRIIIIIKGGLHNFSHGKTMAFLKVMTKYYSYSKSHLGYLFKVRLEQHIATSNTLLYVKQQESFSLNGRGKDTAVIHWSWNLLFVIH